MAGRLKQVITTDIETGELISDVTTVGCPNGKGFVLMYSEKCQDLLLKIDSAATLKVFMLIAMNQHYDEHGYTTTKKAVQEKLGITKPTCLAAFRWLKENNIICETKVDGNIEFMVNPDYVTVGRDKKARVKEWNRRKGYLVDDKIVPIKKIKTKPKVIGRSIEG